MHNWSKTIDFFSAVNKFSVEQDTIENSSDSSTVLYLKSQKPGEDSVQKDSSIVKTFQQIELSASDSILQRSEERERLIQEQLQREAAIQRWYRRKVDTTELLYKQFGIAGFPIKEKLEQDAFQQNFLYNFSSVKPREKELKKSVFIESQEAPSLKEESLRTISKDVSELRPQYITGKIQFDWITILLIASFLVLGWVRLFNKKYLGSLLKSILSYQDSNTLYREKHSFMEKASFMFLFLFHSNIAIFVIQLKHFYAVELSGIEDYTLYFIVVASLFALYIFRALSSFFIGFVFLKQKIFSEYFHNVNLFTKNTGLLMLPIVIVLQFLSYEYLGFIVYTGMLIISFLYLLQLVRSFQIINRKNVSIFYMILYLCAFEFAPFLIIYKLLVSYV